MRNESLKLAFLLFGTVTAIASLQAAVKLGLPFSDHAVLQREKPVAVWGWTDSGEKVTVTFADQVVETTADAKGEWRVNLKPMSASKTPRYLHSSPWHGALYSEVNLPVGAFHVGY